MEMIALKTAILYESKLIRRSWLFHLFILGILGYTIGVLIPWDIHHTLWSDIALASSIPSSGVYFLNLFQSLTVTFIVCDIQRKRKRAETREVLSARPIGNGQFFLGGFLGILIPFLIVDAIFMLVIAFISVVTPDSPVNLWVNLFYLLIRVLPALVFITGLSLLVSRLVKHSFITWLILLIFLYFAYSHLTTPLHGILDFWGLFLPESFSTLVGFIHIEDNLLHRSAFLLIGISFLYFAVPLTKRLPGTPGLKPYFIVSGSLFLIFSLCLGYFYVNKFHTRLENRIAYRETFLKYNEHPTSRILTHDITYRPEGDKFSAISQMRIQNQKKVKMEQILLFLNPGLKINKIVSNGQSLSFHRDHQVIVIEHSLALGEDIELDIEYGGYIDEDIYQVNIPDNDFFAPLIYTSYHENYGKRSAFVSDNFTLLIPEVMWYPAAVPSVELLASKEINFTSYTLCVEKPSEVTVLSQGKPTNEGDKVTFNNVQNLTGLSLCMGKYEKRSVTVDSIIVELYTYPGNDFYMKPLDEWEVLREGNSNREKELDEIAVRCKNIVEERKLDPYPFKYLKLIETPLSFLRQRAMFSDNTQPEIAFFEERFTTKQNKPGAYSGGSPIDMSVQEEILYKTIPIYLEEMHVGRVFSNFTTSIMSDNYRGMHLIFEQMMNPKGSPSLNVMPSMLKHIAEKGLKGIITEGYSGEKRVAISLKVSHLLGYLTTITTWDSLLRFMQEFNSRTRFQEINFDSFIVEFEQRFGQNIKAFMDEWYTSHEIPSLLIKDLSHYSIGETQILDFKVGNFSETDGIVSIVIGGYTESGKEMIQNWRSYLLKPGECKHIIIHEDVINSLTLTTNFSGNLPYGVVLPRSQPLLSGTIPDESVTLLEREQFYPSGEIIVDNEDENFHLIDSSNNRKRLVDMIKKEDEDEYDLWYNIKTNTWGRPILRNGTLNNFYGEHIRSAFTKAAGTGEFKAEWMANLPEAGRYEIFINRPHISQSNNTGDKYISDYPGMKNHYTVHTLDWEEEIILEVERGDPYWVSLGIFTLPAGESRVVLDDRGVSLIDDMGSYPMKYVQLVVADAVKWVKIK